MKRIIGCEHPVSQVAIAALNSGVISVQVVKSGFSWERVEQSFIGRSFAEGQRLAEHGQVYSYEFNSNHLISGNVSGESSVIVSIVSGDDGSIISVNGRCTCREKFNCKHVAAVLFAARKEIEASLFSHVPTTAEPVAPEIRRWFDRLTEIDDVDQVSGSPKTPMGGRHHIYYVIHANEKRKVQVKVYKAYLKKDGEIGADRREFSLGNGLGRCNFVTAKDATILGRLDFYSGETIFRNYQWPKGDDLVALIREIVETGRAVYSDIFGPTLRWAEPRMCELLWSVSETGLQWVEAQDTNGLNLTLLPFPTPLFVDTTTLEIGVVKSSLEPRELSWMAAAPPVQMGSVQEVEAGLSRVGLEATVPRPNPIKERRGIRPVPVLTLYGCESACYVTYYGCFAAANRYSDTCVYSCARLEFAYDGRENSIPTNFPGDVLASSGDGYVLIRRDPSYERELEETLTTMVEDIDCVLTDFIRGDPSAPEGLRRADVIMPPTQEQNSGDTPPGVIFASCMIPILRADGWQIEFDETWPCPVYDGPVEFSTSAVTSDWDWFSLSLSLEADGGRFDLAPIITQIVEALPVDERGRLDDGFDVEDYLSGATFTSRLDNGRWFALDGQRLVPFVRAFLEAQGLLGFHRAEAGRLFELVEALEGCGVPWTGGKRILELGARLRSLAEATELPAPAALRGELRPYQRIGYGWLRALFDCGFGGVLADDMGLGKTVQALALIAYNHLEKKADGPSLLVVPTSLVGNWRREAAHFVPELKLLVLHGPDRKRRFSEIPDFDLVVTTYPLLNRDHEELFRHEYELAILDEAQAVKNPASMVSKRIREINALQRLALTGTPLENNLQELWSLYDWLVPGLLGNRKSFTRNYRTPIEKRGDQAKQRLLSTRVKPFLMRRTKEEVAPDLPEKTVIDELIPLESAQAALYESIRTVMDERVREAISARGLASSHIMVLDALLKLRQVCCDPGLVKLKAARKVTASAKRKRLLVLLEELISEGRKVLVFSQFVTMLKLLERDISGRGWSYAMLHGSTKDRDAQIMRFQSGDVPIFLISLKAGGTGLNLTAADTVIVYDPWWNPAVERQAMDRAHRIGQDKPVFVHRLIAEGTVEARIQSMQRHKQALADSLFEGAGHGPQSITEEDIQTLFEAN